MPGPVTKSLLLKEMKSYFPDRWEVERLNSKVEGLNAAGTVKIHCREDDKVFLSDFSAKLDSKGRVVELSLDGVQVGKFIGRLHDS